MKYLCGFKRMQKCFSSCNNIWVCIKVLIILEGLGAGCLRLFCCCFQNKFPSSEVYLWVMLKLLKVLLLAEAKKAHSS